MNARRFPPPWSVEELDACFVVKDSSGQKPSYTRFQRARVLPTPTSGWTFLTGNVRFSQPGMTV